MGKIIFYYILLQMFFSLKILRGIKKWHFFILDPRHLFFCQRIFTRFISEKPKRNSKKYGFSWQHSGTGGRPSATFLDCLHHGLAASDRRNESYLKNQKKKTVKKMDSHGSTVGPVGGLRPHFWNVFTMASRQAIDVMSQ